MIAAACESAEKVLTDTRKAYGFGTRQGPTIAPTLDKAQAAKIQEQESILRAAVNYGEGVNRLLQSSYLHPLSWLTMSAFCSFASFSTQGSL